MKELKLYAIYKNGIHKGNQKGISIKDAIKKYLFASSFESLINETEFTSQYTAIPAIENVHFIEQRNYKNEIHTLKKIDSNYWPFIEKYYPNYYSCDQILLSDILTRKIKGEEISIADEVEIKNWNIKKELLKLDQRIMQKAMEHYFAIKHP